MEPGAGGDATFKGIVKGYYERILKYCCYVLGGNRSAAEDCTQDIFLILYENMAKLKDHDNLGGWLYKTAGNISKRYAASLRKERVKFAHPAGNPQDEGEAPVDGIIAKKITAEEERIAEEKAAARAAAAIERSLKPGDEQILELAFRQKLPLKEVANRLNISLSAVKSRASRLRQKISALARELLAD
ncbi:MAG: sigma-70 family RNA polymerase sigma factor [Treponema sp.]|jgi:RNA polymerase sigma-70 factor (ECF subfamily)|nr:sigma-70 family RNA polymerase sigma factor [Treponema sp.]